MLHVPLQVKQTGNVSLSDATQSGLQKVLFSALHAGMRQGWAWQPLLRQRKICWSLLAPLAGCGCTVWSYFLRAADCSGPRQVAGC